MSGHALTGMSLRDTLGTVRHELASAGIPPEEAASEGWILLDLVCGIKREDYYMNQDASVPQEKLKALFGIVDRRKERIPLQYLTGCAWFMGFPFYVDERVLIPRQDTECLVEEALAFLQDESRPRILDLCTGSGCIGIALKKLFPAAEVTLLDLSADALEVAAVNAGRLDAEVEIVQGDLFEGLNGRFDYILSNPPYIPTAVIETLMPEVKDHEPRTALDGEADGLFFYRRIVREAGAYLSGGGWLLFEIGADQGAALAALFEAEGYRQIQIKKDLSGLDRVALARKES